MTHTNKLKIFTVGMEPHWIDYFLTPIGQLANIQFTHGLVGCGSRIASEQKKYPNTKFVSLSKIKSSPLTEPNYEFLASLESKGIPTIKSLVRGDPYLRNRSEREALGYATLLAVALKRNLTITQPDIVLGNFDCIHSGLGLAVAKVLGIPWVALTFTGIPRDLASFCFTQCPDMIVPISTSTSDDYKEKSEILINKVLSGKQNIVGYIAPNSLKSWVNEIIDRIISFSSRAILGKKSYLDQFTKPTFLNSCVDVIRRSVNLIFLPKSRLLMKPPETRYVYYPLHMAPESMIDTWAPFYQDQLAFVAQLSISIPSDVDLVIKLHFSDPANYSYFQLNKMMKHFKVKVASPFASGSEFIDRASLVVGITGTSNLEAALRGIPVLMFADHPYLHFPRTERARRPDQIFEQVSRMLKLPPPSQDEIVEAFATYMARYLPGRINVWSEEINSDDFKKYGDLFTALATYLQRPGVRENWYKQPPFI